MPSSVSSGSGGLTLGSDAHLQISLCHKKKLAEGPGGQVLVGLAHGPVGRGMAGSYHQGEQLQVEAGRCKVTPCEKRNQLNRHSSMVRSPPCLPTQYQGEEPAEGPTWVTVEGLGVQVSHPGGQERKEALQTLPCLAAGHSGGLGQAFVHKAGTQGVAESWAKRDQNTAVVPPEYSLHQESQQFTNRTGISSS